MVLEDLITELFCCMECLLLVRGMCCPEVTGLFEADAQHE